MATYKLIEISQAFNAFDDILDVRSPAEYADDHLPGAISVPVLNDEERARIGTLYTQVSPFEAMYLFQVFSVVYNHWRVNVVYAA